MIDLRAARAAPEEMRRALARKGAVFAYFGDALHPDAQQFPAPRALADEDEFDAFLCYAEWNTFWRYLYDNNLDPMHGTFLHAKSHSMSQGATEARFRVRPTAVRRPRNR